MKPDQAFTGLWLNDQVKRNRDRLPSDFLFQLTQDEKAEVAANCDHFQNPRFSKALPFAFTEHGAIQTANVLASSQGVEMGVYVVRAFYVAATRATQRLLMGLVGLGGVP